MIRAGKYVFSLLLLVTIAQGVRLSQADAAGGDGGGNGISCVMDVVVESRNAAGTLIGNEVYHQEFTLREGETYFDDFSTRTRFKFFDAAFRKVDGEKTISVGWFADVTVFNSVDFTTSVSLEDGNKRGKAVGDNSVYTSNGSTRTKYTLTCQEN